MEMSSQIIPGEVVVASSQYTKEENYWLNKLSGALEKTDFSYDIKRAGSHKGKFEQMKFKLSGELFSKLMKLSSGSGPKLHMILVTVLVILLNKYTGNKDITVGSPIYKQDIEAEFINTVLALRSRLQDHMTFKELLLQVRETIIEADENQNYPVDLLLRKLEIPYQGNGFPLFDIAILLEDIHEKEYLEDINPGMIFSFSRADDCVEGVLEYNSLQYKETLIRQITRHFTQLTGNALNNANLALKDMEILSEEEKRELIFEFNDTRTPYPGDKTIHELFEAQAEKTPNHIALIGKRQEAGNEEKAGSRELTYSELDQKSNRLARLLRKNGAAAESVVGIMMEPSVEMVTGLMAILKAGGAYLPIDPGLPENRVLYMLKDSGAWGLLSNSHTIKDISFTGLRDVESAQDTQLVLTSPRGHIEDFNRLPLPNRLFLNLKNYKNKIGMASVTNCMSLQATRGCPYHCLYCHKIWSKHQVYRNAEAIYNEIEYYYRGGVSNFAFIDDCFNLSKEKSGQVFQLILKNKLNLRIFFPNGLRGDALTPGYIDLMVEAGTRGINLSLETASPRLQKLLKKNLELDTFKQMMDYIASRHPHVILEMASMHGFPGETEEEAMKTLDFIKSIKWIHFPYIHILKIFPNTEMEAFALEQGISKEDIMKSRDRAFHELPETLPFPKSFTRRYQADFLNNYVLSKERLAHVLPHQMKILSETALAQKYNAYLPVEIKSVRDLIAFGKLENIEIPAGYGQEKETAETIFDHVPQQREIPGARKILLLDLSQHFSIHHMLYMVVEQPLGLTYLLTYLKERFANKIDGRIYKSGNDFDNFEELRELVKAYKPDLVGIRTLTFFKEFFHETAALLRQWGVDVPIITGGPYASSDYDTILKDKHIDLVVLGEGEYTLGELIGEMLKKDFKLPGADVLDKIPGLVYKKKTGIPAAGGDQSREIILTDRLESTLRQEGSQSLPSITNGSNLAYVMYTSGSTGKPKGVMVEHRQVNNCISWMQDKFDLGHNHVVVNRTDLTFDPSVWEIFWPLHTGGRVKILDARQRKDAEYLIRLMAEDTTLTMMYCPATLVNMMTYLLETKSEKPRLKLPWLIIGAEPIGMDVVKNFYSYYEGKIVNTYGPTEGTINNTYYDLNPGDKRTIVPIGKPVANNQIYILSPHLQLMPPNTVGEICIAGESVARGYINNREKTHRYFIDNPFAEGRLYKTGDIGRWLEDGTIEIMGRTDEQVKIRGYRIEPGDINASLLKHPAIKDSVVVVKDTKESHIEIKFCKTCGISSTYPRIKISDQQCDLCRNFSSYKKGMDNYFKTLADLEQTIREAQKEKKGEYDLLLLYSGGRGAAYALYHLVDMGFNVLAATYDHGYFSKGDMKNIKMITDSLNVDHIVLSHKNTDSILVESIKQAHTVCRGCYLTSASLAREYAYKNNINLIVGATLSRGQIIENELIMFLMQDITDEKELEKEISKFQESLPDLDKNIFDHIDIDVIKNRAAPQKVKSINFYRYCEVQNEEMISYLNNRDPYWKTRKNYAIYSTNCPIKQIGDYGHLRERGFHFYGSATIWEKRLGHITADNVKEDLQCGVTGKGFEKFLKKIGLPSPKRRQEPEKYLYAYIVPDKPETGIQLSVSQLRKYLETKIPAYMIPTHFMQIEKIPLTPNGKIDRKTLQELETEITGNEAEYEAPGDEAEKKLAEMWIDTLEVKKIGINDNFFNLGGDSLKATILVSQIRKAFDVEFPLSRVFSEPTIKGFADFIRNETRSVHENIKPVEKKGYYPLSSAQKRLFFLDRFEVIKTSYNMPFFLKIQGKIDDLQFENAFKELIRRHETLRTSFGFVGDETVQRVHDTVEFKLQRVQMETGALNRESIEKTIGAFIRPFDLAKAPLMRIGLVTLGENENLFMHDMHHIVSDGTSLGVVVDELTRLYGGEELPRLNVQYKDFSHWQNNLFETDEIKHQEEYWRQIYPGEIPRLNLPTDYPRPIYFSFDGDHFGFKLDARDSLRFKQLAVKREATLFMNLLAALNVLFYKYTGQEDIVIGNSIAGRFHDDLQHIIGMFVNKLAIRNHPRGEKTYGEFLEEVKANCIEAFENQDMQFENLVEKLNPNRDTSQTPMFNVSLVVQNFETKVVDVKDLRFIPYEHKNITAKFDINLFAIEIDDEINFNIEYYTKIFKRETIRRLAAHFVNVITQVSKNPDIHIVDTDLLSREEKQLLIDNFNETAAIYPKDKTISEWFEAQVEKTPRNTAVVYKDQSLSFRDLEKKANQLANYLYAGKNIRPNDRVGILMAPSINLIVAILGILKAGGAYVPMDTSLPEERLKNLVDDAEIAVVISSKRNIRILNRLQWDCQWFDTFLCMDSTGIYSEEEVEKSEKMDKELWEYIGQTAVDEITGGGWFTSYTGEPFTREEMDEYSNNIFKKLMPLLQPGMKVLEIGCASGISMFRIAPHVGLYYGTDLSSIIIEQNKKKVEEQGCGNIRLACLPAHEIDKIEDKDFDLVILNSVIQSFHGHNYLRKVIGKIIDLLGKTGHIFIGDVLDQELKENLKQEMNEFKRKNRDKNYNTKTDWSTDLFVSRRFFKDLILEFPGIHELEFTGKIYTLENELTKFRYDTLIKVDKTKTREDTKKTGKKYKYQHDSRILQEYETGKAAPRAKPGDLVYVIYTSGTTGKPKGVLVKNENLVNYSHWFAKAGNLAGKDKSILTSSYAFDLGYTSIFPLILTGGECHIVPRETYLDPETLLNYIREKEISYIKVTPSLFTIMVNSDYFTGEMCRKLRLVVLGGEPINLEDVEKAHNTGYHIQVMNHYGPTEATIGSIAQFIDFNNFEEYKKSPTIGKPISNTRVYIIDKNDKLLPLGVPGELCISGDCLAKGYLNATALTLEKFVTNPFEPGKTMYRTGDLARWLSNGNIEFLGRIDNQVKIRGYRIELGEIENCLLKNDDIKESVVTIKKDESGERSICAYFLSEKEVEIPGLKEYLSNELPDYMIPAYFMQIEEIPLTPNGKVDRKALPRPGVVITGEYAPPRDHLDKKLLEIWSEILNLEKRLIGLDADFFALGGHSLKVTVLVARIHKELNVKVPLAEVFDNPNIRGLAEFIKGLGEDRYASVEPLEKREYYELSSAQKRMYILQQMDLESTAYHRPRFIPLAEVPDMERFRENFQELIHRHESLRTSFHLIGDETVQKIHHQNQTPLEIEYFDLTKAGSSQVEPTAVIDNFIRPFDLSRVPLFRVGILKTVTGDNLLMVDMHHIISDGISHDILVDDFKAFPEGRQLPPLRIQYKDFSQWQNREKKKEKLARQEAYWLKEFEGEIPVLGLPTDFPRPGIKSYRGRVMEFSITDEEARKLKEFAGEIGATLYMVTLAIYNVFLSKVGGLEDILVGTPSAGRNHADFQNIIGMFVNTLVLRNYPGGEKTFKEFAGEVKTRTLQAFENQDYQFEDLVEVLGIKRNPSRNPLFDFFFTLQKQDEPGGDPGEEKTLALKPYPEEFKSIHFDMILNVIESDEKVSFVIEYITKLFKEETVKRYVNYFKDILSKVMEDSSIKLKDITIIRSLSTAKAAIPQMDFGF